MKEVISLFSDILLISSFLISILLLIPLIPVVDQWYQLAIVKSGSMEPFLKVGSLAIYRKQKDYFPGEVIAYHKGDGVDKKLILHRIIAKNPQMEKTSFLTHGDATQYLSPDGILLSQIQGKVIASIPQLGFIVSWFKGAGGISLLIFICLFSLIKQITH